MDQRLAGSVGKGNGVNLPNPRGNPCGGTLLLNYDGSAENAYCWRYGGIVPPYYGAFAECYSYNGCVCGIELGLTGIGDPCAPCDLYVWDDAGGVPGNVLCMTTGNNPCPVATWPNVGAHDFGIPACRVSGAFWIGYWADFSAQNCGYYVAADLTGFGGCPYTNIAPGIGYPTGWQDTGIVWGPTESLSIGAWVTDYTFCIPTGACCRPALCEEDGACEVMTQADCESQHGVYQGDNTTCGRAPCTRRGRITKYEGVHGEGWPWFLGAFWGPHTYITTAAHNSGQVKWDGDAHISLTLCQYLTKPFEDGWYETGYAEQPIGGLCPDKDWGPNKYTFSGYRGIQSVWGKLVVYDTQLDKREYHTQTDRGILACPDPDLLYWAKWLQLIKVFFKPLHALLPPWRDGGFAPSHPSSSRMLAPPLPVTFSIMNTWPDSGYANADGAFEMPTEPVRSWPFVPRGWMRFVDDDSSAVESPDGSDSIEVQIAVPANAEPDSLLFRIHAEVQDPDSGLIKMDRFGAVIIVSAAGVKEGAPTAGAVTLGPPTPNPCRGPVSFPLTLASETRVRLQIFDNSGRLVARIADEVRGPGPHAFHWDPPTARRGRLPSGMYRVRLEAGGVIHSRTLIVLR